MFRIVGNAGIPKPVPVQFQGCFTHQMLLLVTARVASQQRARLLSSLTIFGNSFFVSDFSQMPLDVSQCAVCKARKWL